MSVLERAAKPARKPLICTIVGVGGAGKTSMASTFPQPIYVPTQGEALPRDLAEMPDSMPELTSAGELWDIFKALLSDPHEYKTLIIDTATGLETLFTQDVLDQERDNGGKARGIVQALGGYGAGPAAVTASHMRVRRAAEFLRERRGMNVVFLAHADVADISLPDSDPFSQYTLRLPKKSIAPYTDQVDLVGFLRQDRIVRGAVEAKDGRGGKAGRAITSGDRSLSCVMNPATVAKNRLGITDDIEVTKGVNPLGPWLDDAPKPRGRPKKVTNDEATDAMEGEDK